MSEAVKQLETPTLSEIGLPRTPNVDPSKYPKEIFELYSVPSFSLNQPEIVPGSAIGSTKQLVEPGDVLLCKIVPHLVRVWCVPSRGTHRQIASGEWIVVRPDPEKADKHYLRYALTEPGFRSQFMETVSGVGGSLMRARPKAVALIPVPLPAKAEQRRIVTKLDSLFNHSKSAREELTRIPRLVDRYRQAIFGAAFRGELTTQWREQNPKSRWTINDQQRIRERRQKYMAGRRGSRLRDAAALLMEGNSDLPGSWMSGCLADVADLRTGYAFKSTWFSNDGPKLLRGANIAPGHVIWDDTKRLSPDQVPEFEKEFRLSAGDIVIAMDRPLIAGGLKVAILGDEDEGAFLVQRVASPVCSPLVVPKFLWFLINSRTFIEHIEQHATGSDLPHISSNDILTTPLPLPPIQEQREIASIIEKACESISKQLAETLRASALLERLDQATLSRAFRGGWLVHSSASAANG